MTVRGLLFVSLASLMGACGGVSSVGLDGATTPGVTPVSSVTPAPNGASDGGTAIDGSVVNADGASADAAEAAGDASTPSSSTLPKTQTGVTVGATVTFTQSAPGHTYYVGQTNASDSNAGTSTSAPLSTIHSAMSRAAAGDTIYLMGGGSAYNLDAQATACVGNNSGVCLSAQGKADNWIALKGMNDPVIQGTNTGHGTSDYANCFVVPGSSGNYIDVEGITCNGGRSGIVAYSGVTGVRVHDVTFNHLGSNITAFYYAKGEAAASTQIEISGVAANDADNGCANGCPSTWGGGIQVDGTYITLADNTVSGVYGEGFDITGRYVWVTNNHTTNTCSGLYYLIGLADAVVEKNYGSQDPTQPIFSNCPIFSPGNPANVGQGIIMANECGALSYLPQSYNSSSDILIRNNLLYNALNGIGWNANYGSYCAYPGSEPETPMNDVIIENNDIISGSYSYAAIVVQAASAGSHSGVQLINNIIGTYKSGAYSSATLALSTTTGISFSHNLFVDGSQYVGSNGNVSESAPGFMGDSFDAPSSFALSASSPALNAGTSTSNDPAPPTDDFFGTSRPKSGPVAIGAVQ